MKLSTKGRYGLRVMIELAVRAGLGPVPEEAIARQQALSGKYIHVLVAGLRSAGLVRTSRGPSGGYELARPPGEITALDVVEALEGPLAPVECIHSAASCPRIERCASREVWCEVSQAIRRVLGAWTLDRLAARQRDREAIPLDDYSI